MQVSSAPKYRLSDASGEMHLEEIEPAQRCRIRLTLLSEDFF